MSYAEVAEEIARGLEERPVSARLYASWWCWVVSRYDIEVLFCGVGRAAGG